MTQTYNETPYVWKTGTVPFPSRVKWNNLSCSQIPHRPANTCRSGGGLSPTEGLCTCVELIDPAADQHIDVRRRQFPGIYTPSAWKMGASCSWMKRAVLFSMSQQFVLMSPNLDMSRPAWTEIDAPQIVTHACTSVLKGTFHLSHSTTAMKHNLWGHLSAFWLRSIILSSPRLQW